MPEFRFDDATHTYWLDGVQLPSVSRLLAPIVDLSGIPPGVLERKANLGKHVHQLTHLYDMSLMTPADLRAEEHGQYALGWVAFTDQHECEWSVMEKPLYHAGHRYAGTPDRYGLVDGVLTVLDIKTVYTLRPSTGPQMSGYDILLGSLAQQRLAVKLNKDGTYTLKKYDDERATFLSLLNLYHWRQKHGISG